MDVEEESLFRAEEQEQEQEAEVEEEGAQANAFLCRRFARLCPASRYGPYKPPPEGLCPVLYICSFSKRYETPPVWASVEDTNRVLYRSLLPCVGLFCLPCGQVMRTRTDW